MTAPPTNTTPPVRYRLLDRLTSEQFAALDLRRGEPVEVDAWTSDPYSARGLSVAEIRAAEDPTPGLRISPRAPAVQHLQSCFAKLDRLSELPAGWDGYGAEPVSADAIQHAREALARATTVALDDGMHIMEPDVVPGRAGQVQLEWNVGAAYLELEFMPDGRCVYLMNDGQAEQEATIDAAAASGLTLLFLRSLVEVDFA